MIFSTLCIGNNDSYLREKGSKTQVIAWNFQKGDIHLLYLKNIDNISSIFYFRYIDISSICLLENKWENYIALHRFRHTWFQA